MIHISHLLALAKVLMLASERYDVVEGFIWIELSKTEEKLHESLKTLQNLPELSIL